MADCAIVWFRQDLRIQDNPALSQAANMGIPLLFVYILDEQTSDWQMGGASRWWLHHSLFSLSHDLREKYQAPLILMKGDVAHQLNQLIKTYQPSAIFWNRCYEPHYIARDQGLKKMLQAQKIKVQSFNGALLKEPWEMQNGSQQPYKVFTPFFKALQKELIRDLYPTPEKISSYSSDLGLDLNNLGLIPKIDWFRGIENTWNPGESTAHLALEQFIAHHLGNYSTARNIPGITGTSRLSPHLHFGEISPVQIWHAVLKDKLQAESKDGQSYLSEICWREFSYHLLYHFPDLPKTSFKKNFESFPWQKDNSLLKRWQKGQTGYPIVDAGMRELWCTGWMHNRVRMIVASFLIKHLLQPWQDGEAWFWDTLVDADLASNAASWQWVAGSGADAAPYFRIFNPVLQGEKFDPEGRYIKTWVPELEKLPIQYIHTPWDAPAHILKSANISLGLNYPAPIVEHHFARQRALLAYQNIKNI